ncbi:MAG: hypothetical protein ACYC55_07220 [Candidatus Geothermincolia bacterium]
MRRSHFIAAAASLMTLIFAVYMLAFYGAIDSSGHAFTVFTDLAPVIAAAAALAGAIYVLGKLGGGGGLRRFWGLMAFFAALWLAGETVWFLYEGVLRAEVPYPSAADAFWLAGYLPLFAALAVFILGYRRLGLRFDLARSWWIIPVVVAVIGAGVAFVARPILTSADLTLVEKIVNPAYALLDLLILIPALIFALTLGKGAAAKPWLILSCALMAFSLGDISYIWISHNGLYYLGNPIDLFWIGGYLLTGLAAVWMTAGRRLRTVQAGGDYLPEASVLPNELRQSSP